MRDESRKGRTVPFADADREIARQVAAANPDATRVELARLFEREAGRRISLRTLGRLLPSSIPPREDDLPASPPARNPKFLSDGLRSALLSILEERPRATCAQVARIFEGRTGRGVDRTTVRYYRHRLASPFEPDRRVQHLSEEQRGVLLELVRESAPEYSRVGIAESFAELTGRQLSRQAVSVFLIKTLGFRPQRKGTYVRRDDPERAALSLAEAHRQKLESTPIDRSVRPGRTSRITA